MFYITKQKHVQQIYGTKQMSVTCIIFQHIYKFFDSLLWSFPHTEPAELWIALALDAFPLLRKVKVI